MAIWVYKLWYTGKDKRGVCMSSVTFCLPKFLKFPKFPNSLNVVPLSKFQEYRMHYNQSPMLGCMPSIIFFLAKENDSILLDVNMGGRNVATSWKWVLWEIESFWS